MGFVARRFRISLVLFSIAFIFGGLHSMGDAMKYRQPVTMDIATFIKQSPDEGWYTITGGTLDIAAAIPDRTKYQYYIPLRLPPSDIPAARSASAAIAGVSETDSSDTDVLVLDKDAADVKMIDAYHIANHRPATMDGTAHWASLPTPTQISRQAESVSGMVGEVEDHESSGEDEEMRVLVKDKHPNGLYGLGMIILGICIAIGVLPMFGLNVDFSALNRRSQNRAPQASPMAVRPSAPGSGSPYYAAPQAQMPARPLPARTPPPPPPKPANRSRAREIGPA